MKKFLTALLCFAAAVLIVLFLPRFAGRHVTRPVEDTAVIGQFGQQALAVSEQPVTVHPVYQQGKLIGIVLDKNKLMRHLKQVYRTKYKEDYPDSAVYLARDMYMTSEEGYFTYTDADD